MRESRSKQVFFVFCEFYLLTPATFNTAISLLKFKVTQVLNITMGSCLTIFPMPLPFLQLFCNMHWAARHHNFLLISIAYTKLVSTLSVAFSNLLKRFHKFLLIILIFFLTPSELSSILSPSNICLLTHKLLLDRMTSACNKINKQSLAWSGFTVH